MLTLEPVLLLWYQSCGVCRSALLRPHPMLCNSTGAAIVDPQVSTRKDVTMSVATSCSSAARGMITKARSMDSS